MAGFSSMFMAGMAGASLAGAQSEAKAYEVQANYTTEMNKINQRRADLAAEDALKRGAKESNIHLQKVKAMSGSQKVALAAQGISLDQGSAQDIQADTKRLGYEDALTIQNNAFREALGYGQQKEEYARQSTMAQMEASSRGYSTMLTGGMRAAGHFNEWGKNGGYAQFKK